jgi:menaquinone-dependent protoporphyrinogen IX oxidase
MARILVLFASFDGQASRVADRIASVLARGGHAVSVRRTGWRPREVAAIAGALAYSKYNVLIRFLMRLIVGAAGGDTDTSRDYEYTDWDAVERFAARFSSRLQVFPEELAA